MEYELLDTGIFDDDRYFDVFVEYAKDGAEDVLVKITAVNRGPDAAELHLLPTLWFRNDWRSWIPEADQAAEKPDLRQIEACERARVSRGDRSAAGRIHLFPAKATFHCSLPTMRRTFDRLLPGYPNASPYVKDGINNFVVAGNQGAVNPEKQGTKVAAHYRLTVGAGQSATRVRLTAQTEAAKRGRNKSGSHFGTGFDKIMAARLKEADEFYARDPAIHLAGRCQRDAPGYRRNAVEQAILFLRRGPVVERT